MTKGTNNPDDSKFNATSGLAVPKKPVKLQYRKIPTVRPGDTIRNRTKGNIENLLREALESSPVAIEPVTDSIERISRIQLNADDCLTPAEKLMEQKYEEKSLFRPRLLRLASSDKEPRSFTVGFNGGDAFAFTSPGMKKSNGTYQENTDGVVVNGSAGDILTALLICSESEGTEEAPIMNAATVYAANELDLGKGERFPLNLDEIKKKTAPVSEEFGLENPDINGLMLRLNLRTYALEVSGNTDKVHCLVIDPKTGTMDTYQQAKQERRREIGENSLQQADFKRLRAAIEKDYSGTKRENMLKKLDLVQEQGFTDDERNKLIARMPMPGQQTVEMPVSSGDIVLLASDLLLKAIKSRGKESGVVSMITEGLAKGKSLREICSEIMAVVLGKQEGYEVEDKANSLVAFRVP